MGIFRNQAANVVAKSTAEDVPLDDYKKWMSGGGIRQWVRQRKREYLEGDREVVVIGRMIRWKQKAVTNYYRL